MKADYNKNKAEKILQISITALSECESGKYLDDVLDSIRKNTHSKTVADILFNYFRNRAFIYYIIARFANNGKKKSQAKFKRILAVVITQAFFQSGISAEIACDVAVGLTRKKYGSRPAGFINAVLRQVLSIDKAELLDKAPENIKLNIPQTLFDRWKKTLPDFINTLPGFNSSKPDMTFRVTGAIPPLELEEANCTHLSLPEWADGSDFYIAENPAILFEKKWIQNGQIYIQDPSTVLASSMYVADSEHRVLDLCSAPGGKSLLLAEKMKEKGILISSDISVFRQFRTKENISAHKIDNCHIISASALAPPFSANFADIVFLDVPCTNTGVFRRRPDVLWNFTEQKLKELVDLQIRILNKTSELVKPSGYLIYSTCSIEKEENTHQIRSFLKEHSEFKLIKERQLFPCKIHDGAYSTLLKKEK